METSSEDGYTPAFGLLGIPFVQLNEMDDEMSPKSFTGLCEVHRYSNTLKKIVQSPAFWGPTVDSIPTKQEPPAFGIPKTPFRRLHEFGYEIFNGAFLIQVRHSGPLTLKEKTL